MTDLQLWLVIGAMGAVTFLTRLSMIALLGRAEMPGLVQRGLRYVPPAVLSAIGAARETARDLPLFAGGKSLGGRMTSLAALPPQVKGLVFFGFPLHAPGKPSTGRADHLSGVTAPMLFLQGTRDTFAGLDLIKPVCSQLGDMATLHIVEGADHSFHMLKSAGMSDEQALKHLALTAAGWMSRLL